MAQPPIASSPPTPWQPGQTIDLAVESLSNSGDGIGRWQERVVFVPNTVPGDQHKVKLIKLKPNYAVGKSVALMEPSPHRIRPACIVADKCGGCQWQAVDYAQQLIAKQQQVADALARIGGFNDLTLDPILAAEPLSYRNKATYPLARSQQGTLKAGYYRAGTHQIVNLNQCPIQDDRLDPLLAGIKQSIQANSWSIYNEERHRGRLRHLALRVGHHTGECLVTLVSTSPITGLEDAAQQWLETYPGLVGVCLNLNSDKTNVVFGQETRCVAGQAYLTENFLGLQLRIGPTTFFQVNTAQAERLVQVILDELALTPTDTVVDAYCGIGTLTLPLARQAGYCIGLESQAAAIEQARHNAAINQIKSVDFRVGPVETQLAEAANAADVVVLDPPRKGCAPAVLTALLAAKPARIAYMSCNPTTLARDLKILCNDGGYRLTRVQPADFFPQTAHVECVAFLVA
ncbi:MAG: 23S rRNA (uracil(1939)-C(5))-methyltransferase RlmD [Cyanobacteria bacterium J06627_15]